MLHIRYERLRMLHIRDRWFCPEGAFLSAFILRVLSYLSTKISTGQMTVLSMLLLNKGRLSIHLNCLTAFFVIEVVFVYIYNIL